MSNIYLHPQSYLSTSVHYIELHITFETRPPLFLRQEGHIKTHQNTFEIEVWWLMLKP